MNFDLILLIVGSISFFILIFILFFFGKLIWLQLRIWLLAKQGYQQVEHVGEDNVRRYFYIRPKDSSFKFDKGIYILQKDAITKSGDILRKVDGALLKSLPEAEAKEVKDLYERATKFRYDPDVVTLRWGIPTITYYGNDPNPVNFKERKKIYDSKNISALIQRILLTKEWKLVRIVLILCCVAIVMSIALGFLYWNSVQGVTKDLSTCNMQLNTTNYQYTQLLNYTNYVRSQSSNVTV